MQGRGGGLMVYGTATLTNTNVYENVAYVRLHFEPSWSSAPAPRWNVLCARILQDDGGGLNVWGTATLTNTNVYTNQASVRAHLPPLPRPFLQRPAELTVHPPLAGRGERWPILNQAT